MKTKYNIGIIGSGKMGRDLLDFLSAFPFPLILVCSTEEALKRVSDTFQKKQKRLLKYQLINQDAFNFRQQNTLLTTNQKHLENCNIVIETITEDLQKKRELFHQLLPKLSIECVLASNTSSIPPGELFSGFQNEANCLGLHFFFPVGMKDIVEVNVTEKTSEKTVSFIKGFLKVIRKNAIVLQKENHFIINRIFLKMQAGCCQLLQEEKWSIQEIDDLVKAKLFSVGIFEFFDSVGNDVMLQSVKNYIQYEKDRTFYQPLIQLLEQKVADGKMGVKSKSGFYEYPLKKSSQAPLVVTKEVQKITHWYLEGVFDVYKKSICTKDELAHIVKEYMMIEKNPFELAEEISYSPK